METKNTTTRYSKEFRKSIIDLLAQGIEIVHSDMRSQYTIDLFNQTLQTKK